jgi:hypothetical protein
MPHLHETPMGREFYDSTMKGINKSLKRIADAMEQNKMPPTTEVLTKELIIKYASEDELFAVFHTFKEYLRENLRINQFDSELQRGLNRLPDKEIGDVIKKLKETYK